MKIEFIYEKTCPNIEPTREQLVAAFDQLKLAPTWQEWEVSNATAPAYVHGYGSPTILINGKDLLGAAPNSDDMSCRIYPNSPSPNRGVPAAATIVAAMQAADANGKLSAGIPSKKFFGLNLSMLPTFGIALLPKLFCPACWPAYAGLLSSMGLGFFDYTPYLLPAMLFFIAIALGALVYRASQRHGHRPFYLGLVASGILLLSKFHFDNDPLMWFGLVLLMTASLWNTWPKKQAQGFCPACEV